MKTLIALLFLLSPLFPLSAQTPLAQWKLTGIMVTPGQKQVLFQEGIFNLILREDESEDGATVLKIDPSAEIVMAKDDQTNITFHLNVPTSANSQTAPYCLTFDRANARGVLDFYARSINRTLIVHPDLWWPVFTKQITASDEPAAMREIENALADMGAATIPDGNRFMLLVPEHIRSQVKPAAPAAPASTPPPQTPGMIDFIGVDITQAADVYAKLSGGRLDRQANFPVNNSKIYFKTMTPLSKADIIYAFKTLFAWENLRLEPTGNGLFKVVTISN